MLNPYDHDRDFFIQVCKREVEYFKKVSVEVLKELYYRSTHHFIEREEQMFGVGERCRNIFIVFRGVIETSISDGITKSYFLDLLGRGSVFGQDNIITQEMWAYKARSVSDQTSLVVRIKRKVLFEMAAHHSDLLRAVQIHKEHL